MTAAMTMTMAPSRRPMRFSSRWSFRRHSGSRHNRAAMPIGDARAAEDHVAAVTECRVAFECRHWYRRGRRQFVWTVPLATLRGFVWIEAAIACRKPLGYLVGTQAVNVSEGCGRHRACEVRRLRHGPAARCRAEHIAEGRIARATRSRRLLH